MSVCGRIPFDTAEGKLRGVAGGAVDFAQGKRVT
jgi:hypothetical protein